MSARILVLWTLIVSSASIAAERQRVIFSRLLPGRLEVFVADADGRNARLLMPGSSLDYNPSLSADGEWVLFTSERDGSADLYRVRANGSGVERLTDDPAYDDQGAVSPDGREVAFVSTRGGGKAHIWVLDIASRRCRKLTDGVGGDFRPSWSPDGKWIAFSSDREGKPGRDEPSWELLQSTAIYVVRGDGTGLRRVTESGGYFGSPKWSRDGRRLLAYQGNPKQTVRDRTSSTATTQIVSVDVATGDVKGMTTGPGFKLSPAYVAGEDAAYVVKGGARPGLAFVSGREGATGEFRNPCWSQDGKRVVFHRSSATEPNRMTPAFNRDKDFELYLTGNFPAYSPDGKLLAYTARRPGRLMVVNADGTQPRQILDVSDEEVVFPSWSPDGKDILFAMGGFFARPVKPSQLALVRPDGSNLRPLTRGEASSGFPSWSPDGKRVVYRVMGSGEQGLRILSLEDGRITTLTREYDTFPAWSPAGDLIAFTSFRDGDYEMYTIRPDGSGLRKLTQSRGNDAHSSWSPDGKWIVFSSSRMGFKDEMMREDRGPQPYGEMFAMRSDGSDVRQLTDNQWEDATPAWLPRR